jgi:hypothetical protein
MPNTSRPQAPIAMPIDGDQLGWVETYSQSPAYSPSSGCASPNMGSGDYNLYTFSAYNHGPNRTRTPSNASINDQWSYTPRSPVSSISTMPHTWASNDKIPSMPCIAYLHTSYSISGLGIPSTIDATVGYTQFEPRTMMQRDEDEAGILFRDQPYGMGQVANTYSFEQYLNNYWRLFHPTFPIVHRSTFGGMSTSPMLCAAMIAIDGQFSNNTSTKRNSRLLHDRCIKMLAKVSTSFIVDGTS